MVARKRYPSRSIPPNPRRPGFDSLGGHESGLQTCSNREKENTQMAMSRKHYREFARVINVNREVAEEIDVSPETLLVSVANGLASVFAVDNPAFDRVKFLEACGFQVVTQ